MKTVLIYVNTSAEVAGADEAGRNPRLTVGVHPCRDLPVVNESVEQEPSLSPAAAFSRATGSRPRPDGTMLRPIGWKDTITQAL